MSSRHGSASMASVLAGPSGRGGEGWCFLAPHPFPLSCRNAAVLTSVLCHGCLIHTSHLLTASQALLRHQPPLILFCEENHSGGDRKTRAVLGQGWGWPVTLEESSECPHGTSQASRVAWWPPGGAKAGGVGGAARVGQAAGTPSVVVLCAGSRAVPPWLRSSASCLACK